VITLGDKRDIEVLTSEARITIERDDGASVSIRRAIKGDAADLVEVSETSKGKAPRLSRLRARRGTMSDEAGGLQRFLYEWLGLPRAKLMTLKGVPSEIYLENVAPLFFIDQNEGWTDLQALQVYRYGLQEVAEAAVEYLLGAKGALGLRFERQELVSIEARLKGEAEKLSERVVEFFGARGWTLKWSTHGAAVDVAKRWGARALSEVARDEFNMDAAAERRRLDGRIVSLRAALASQPPGTADLSPASQASQQVVELKTKRHELRGELRDARMQLADQQGLLTTIEHRIHSSKDVFRLKTHGIGRLDLVECPTCHRDLDPSTFQLTDQSAPSVQAHIEALSKQRVLIQANIASLEAENARLQHELGVVGDTLTAAERGLATVNQAVGTMREGLAKIATDLAAAERELDAQRAFTRGLAELEANVKRWIEEVRAAAEREIDLSDLRERVATFEGRLRSQLLALGHSAVTKATEHELRLDDRYTPYLGPRRLRSLGSASDHPRLVAAYALALAEASRIRGGPHPGVVILDEPLQQNPDENHVKLMLRFLETAARETTNQVIVTTFLKHDQLARLQRAGVPAQQLPGSRFLQPVPDKVSPP
jgi:DNA repair exonuclease SbcCD ATPase subunit